MQLYWNRDRKYVPKLRLNNNNIINFTIIEDYCATLIYVIIILFMFKVHFVFTSLDI